MDTSDRPSESRQSRLWEAIFWGWVILAIIVLFENGQRIHELLFSNRIALNFSADPRPGSTIRLPMADFFGKSVSPRGGGNVLLVAASSCQSCSERIFDPRTTAVGEYSLVVLIYLAGPQDMPRYLSRLGPNVRVISDPSSTWMRQLNPVFDPRFYLLDRNFRVLDCGKNPGFVPAFVHRKG